MQKIIKILRAVFEKNCLLTNYGSDSIGPAPTESQVQNEDCTDYFIVEYDYTNCTVFTLLILSYLFSLILVR